MLLRASCWNGWSIKVAQLYVGTRTLPSSWAWLTTADISTTHTMSSKHLILVCQLCSDAKIGNFLVHWLWPIVAIFDISLIQGNVLVETCQLWQSLTSREMYLSILANCGNLNCHLWRSFKLFHVLLRILATLLLLSTCSLFLLWDT